MEWEKSDIIRQINDFLREETEWWYHGDQMILYLPEGLYNWLQEACQKLPSPEYFTKEQKAKKANSYASSLGIEYLLKITDKEQPYVTVRDIN